MAGPLPERSLVSRGIGPSVGEADVVDFGPGSAIPTNWVYWRAPFNASDFAASPKSHPNTLRMTASRSNLTRDASFNVSKEGVTAIFRRQEHTFFNFTVDIELGFGKSAGDEMGVSAYVNPNQHVDLGIVYVAVASCNGQKLEPRFQLRARSINNFTAPEPKTLSIPSEWSASALRFRVSPINETHHEFFACPASDPRLEQSMWIFNNALIAGDGSATGGLLGVYATTNGGDIPFDGYVRRWRYAPVSQKVDYDTIVLSSNNSR